MPSYLITGANRGLGLGFTAELLKNKENTVVATARDTAGSSGLQELKAKDKNGQLFLVDLDLSKPESIHAAAEKTAQLLPGGLDTLISNAGVSYSGLKSFEEIDVKDLSSELDFTVTANVLLVREFLPLVQKSDAKKIVLISSILGSIQTAVHLPGNANGYSVSRAALNMLARKWSATLKNDGITMAIVHPGWSNGTEIGDTITEWMTKYAPHMESMSIETMSENTIKIVNSMTIEDSGDLFNYDGTKLPF